MEIAKSNIVRSDAGRDKGKLFVVLDVEGEFLLLAVQPSRLKPVNGSFSMISAICFF